MRKLFFITFLPLLFTLNTSRAGNIEQILASAPEISFQLIATHPHSKRSFTQGLVFSNERLYESAGHYGRSRVFSYSLGENKETLLYRLPKNRFAEGITLLDNKLYQLNWKSGLALVYDLQKQTIIKRFSYQGEGWGLTDNGKLLIKSNGSNRLEFINPENFAVQKVISVTANKQPLSALNELEWVNGFVYANIWLTDYIVKIDPNSGEVIAKMNLATLTADMPKTTDNIANGIAYNPKNQHFYLTGKYWPALFEIKLNTL